MNALILAPLLMSLAVPDAGKLDGPTLAADTCVQTVTTGKFEEAPLTANGWKQDKDKLKDSSFYTNPAARAVILVGKSKDGKPKCTVFVVGTEIQLDLVEYRLAAHFNGRIYPLNQVATGFQVPGHDVALFSTRGKVKDEPMLEIMAIPFVPSAKK